MQKYKGCKVANTGIDPHGGFLEFVKKDIIRNIDVHRDNEQQREMKTIRNNMFNQVKDKWAVGCTKHTTDKVDDQGHLKPELRRNSS